MVLSRGELGYIANDGRADAEIEEAVITRKRKNENPDSESGVSQTVENEWRQEESNYYIDAQSKPIRAYVLDDLPIFKCAHRRSVTSDHETGISAAAQAGEDQSTICSRTRSDGPSITQS